MTELEPYLILAKAQKGRACAALISQVLSNKKIFVFGELLDVPSVAALKDTEHNQSLQTLELFAYGTWGAYRASSSSYLELSEPQATKLKMLTIISLAEQQKIIAYSTLLHELEIDSVRTLEDLIIETIYVGLLSGKIDQRQGIFRVKSTIGRDVKADQISDIVQKLSFWRQRCGALIDVLESSSHRVQEERESGRLQQESAQKIANEVRSRIKEEMASGDFRDARDRDDDGDYGVSSSSSRGGMNVSSSSNAGNRGHHEGGGHGVGSRKRKQQLGPLGITGLVGDNLVAPSSANSPGVGAGAGIDMDLADA